MSESISIPRTGDKPLTFNGKLIDRFAGASPDSPELSSTLVDDLRRRLEVYLYQADSGNYVVWVICRSEPRGSLQRSDAYVGDSSESLARQLRSPECVKAVIDFPARDHEDQALLERELSAHWENVVQLIELSIEARDRARHAVSR